MAVSDSTDSESQFPICYLNQSLNQNQAKDSNSNPSTEFELALWSNE